MNGLEQITSDTRYADDQPSHDAGYETAHDDDQRTHDEKHDGPERTDENGNDVYA